MARAPGLYSSRKPGNVTIVNGAPTTYEDSTAGTSRSITLPPNMLAGDLMVVIHRSAVNNAATLPAGWTETALRDNSGITYVWHKINTGESGTLSFTTAGGRIASIAYAVRGCVRGCTANFTGSNSSNPPSHTTPWPAQYNLWIGAMSTRFTNNAITVAPTNYTGLTTVNNTDGQATNAYVRLGSAHRFVDATDTENPVAFTTTGTLNNQHAVTIGVA